ncbi:MAG: hypothetical protein WAO19_01120 [Candidatus Kryptoniota bacterium]
MVEAILRVLTGNESDIRKSFRLLIQIILTLSLAFRSYFGIVGGSANLDSLNWNRTFDFFFNGDFLLIILLFLVYWYMFYKAIELILSYYTVRCALSAWKFITGKLLLVLGSQPEDRKHRFLRRLYGDLELAVAQDGRLNPGKVVIDFARRLKKKLADEASEPLLNSPVSPYLVFQFVVVYIVILQPNLHLSILLNTVFVIFALALIVAGLLFEVVAQIVFLKSDEIISLIPDLDSSREQTDVPH